MALILDTGPLYGLRPRHLEVLSLLPLDDRAWNEGAVCSTAS